MTSKRFLEAKFDSYESPQIEAGPWRAWDGLLPTMLSHADALAACANDPQLLDADGWIGLVGAAMKNGTNARSLESSRE